MGWSIGDHDNSLMEAFFGSMQVELLDRRTWTTQAELANAIFEGIEAWYNPRRHLRPGRLDGSARRRRRDRHHRHDVTCP